MGSDDRYDQARRHFDDLESEEQVRFLLEASVSTVADGLEQAGRALGEALEDLVSGTRRPSGGAHSSDRPGPAEPETAQRRAPRGESESST